MCGRCTLCSSVARCAADSQRPRIQPQYQGRVLGWVPQLAELDNRILKVAKLKNVDELAGLSARMAASDTVADHNEDRGSCSCLEGTAVRVCCGMNLSGVACADVNGVYWL